MKNSQALRTKSMSVRNNKLYIGDFSAEYLASTYKTPLYVYDEAHIRNKLDTYKKYFVSDKFECKVVYASKAFFCPYLASIINEYDMGMDSVSLGDLYMIKHAYFPMSEVVLHGNNKSEEELKYAIENNVGIIVCDSFYEIKKIVSLNPNKKVHILLRVNPGIEAHTHEYIQTSLLSSKFGESIYDTEKILDIVNYLKDNDKVIFEGFHCHIGSSICEAKYFGDACEVMMNFIKDIEDKSGYNINILNLGGGFGIKYLESDKEINLESILKTIINKVEDFVSKNNMKLKKLMIEPGRSIVGDSGSTLYTVGSVKETYGKKKYVFVDGGMTDNIRPALYQASYTVDIASNIDGEEELVDVVGPCCESGDIVCKDVMLTKAKENDILITYCTGAYGYSMSSNYNGSVRGNVIFVNNDKISVGINREDFNTLCMSFPSVSEHKIFDIHSDMLYDLWTKKTRGVKDQFTNYHVNQLRNSCIKAQLWTMYSEFDFDLIEACKIALSEIQMDKLPDFKVILGLEGLRNLKSIEDLDVLYNMGFRHAMLTWNEANRYATGAKADKDRGLTEEGVKLLKRMEELDMIIDLAHLNEKSFYEALNVVSKNVIYSHGNCKAYCGHVRNVTDDQMKALKKVDGLLGLTLANSFIDDDKDNRTFDRYLEHIKHAIDVMGIDNVCFGFDFMDYLSEFPNSNLEDVPNALFAYRIVDGLKKIGLSKEEIDKICYYNFYNRYKNKINLFK